MSKQGKGRGRGQRRNANEGANDFPPLGGASETNVRIGRGRARNAETQSPGKSCPSLTRNEVHSRPEKPLLADKTDISFGKTDLSTISFSISPQERSLQESKFPKRPGYGTAGRQINLVTNYYILKSSLENIYHYDIEITSLDQLRKYGKPVKKKTAAEAAKENISHIEHQLDKNVGKTRCLLIFQKLMEIKKLQSYHPVYDGTKNIFTKSPLPVEFSKSQTFTVDLEDSGKTRKYEVVMQPADKKNGSNAISVKDIMQKKYDGRSEILMALNSVLNHRNPPSSQVQIGRSFFFLNQQKKMELGEGLEIWFGYNQSVHLTESGPALVINLSAKAFHKAGPVIDYASDVLRRDIKTQGALKDYEICKIEEALKKVRVQVTHLKYKRKFYVDGISKKSAKDLKTNIDGREVSIADYFKSKYGALKFPFLPCLFMRSPKNQTYIPLEHCEVIEGQPKLGKLNPALGAKMIKQTAIPPASRFSSIQDSAQVVQNQSGEKMKNYNLLLDLRPLLVSGRVIDSPSLAYQNNSTSDPDNRGVWRIDGKSFLKPPQKINMWVIISFARIPENDLKKLADTLRKTGKALGLNLEKFGGYKIFDHKNTAEKVLCETARNSDITFAVIILNRNDRFHNYDEIKFIADYKLGFVTQCMEDKVLMRLNNQIANNICLKINTKLGGVNHALLHKPVVFAKPVIVLGADAVHSPRGMGCPSIAAVVGSMDAYPSKYKVECRVQENEKNKISQELILEIKDMVKGIFKSFQESTRGKHPEKIIFFRDGVSEGQFKKVRDYEVSAVQKASQDVFGFIIPITFLIVQKRHQTRLRPQNQAHGVGKGGNVPPGTTVDSEITDPEYFDYFLNSHEGIQGTSKPAHYTVLHDDNNFGADELQKISYHLCYMYSKCNRSISIPAPVMYADLACYRAKKYADFHIQKEGMSVSSDSSCRLPDHVKSAINAMGQYKTSMFFL